MNQIKFSYEYEKFANIHTDRPVKLVLMLKSNLSDLSKSFIEYDTCIYDSVDFETQNEYYKLTSRENLVLFFVDCDYNLFSTVRRFTEDKEKYYRSKIGKEFEIKFDFSEERKNSEY
jgi:hypothetical protein